MSKKEDKLTFQRTVIDHETGEILTEEFVHKRSVEPSYIKLYVDCLCSFKGLSKSLNPILLELLKYMSYADVTKPNGGQIIYLNKQLKQDVASATQKSLKRVEQAIGQFKDANIFKQIARGTYQVNPLLFGKGEWKDIKNIIAQFDFGERTVIAEFITEDESNGEDTSAN